REGRRRPAALPAPAPRSATGRAGGGVGGRCGHASSRERAGGAVSANGQARVALVTGASRGIGREVALQLGARGHDVLVSARNGEQAGEVAQELAAQSHGEGEYTPLTLDLADPRSIAAASEQIHANPGRLDVLVNNACPGFVNTDMGGPMGATKSVQDGAAGIVWLATLPDDGPTGGFFRDGKPVAF